jgi:hypothetical protein
VGFALGLWLLIGATPSDEGPVDSRSIARNASASVLAERAVELGIDFDPSNKGAPHPSVADLDALDGAAPAAWMRTQLEAPDESIDAPPAALQTFIERRAGALGAIVAALEKAPPEWSRREEVSGLAELFPSNQLQRVLLAAALEAERAGDPIQANRALEASWALSRPVAESSTLIHQLLATATAKWQAGVLRKVKEPSLAWLGRLTSDDGWQAMLAALDAEAGFARGKDDLQSPDSLRVLERRAPALLAEGLGKLSPCEAANLGEDEAWAIVERGLLTGSKPEEVLARDTYRDSFLPMAVSAVKRAARGAVDRELTWEILILRLEKSQERKGRWPARLSDPVSRVCPPLSYTYLADRAGMEIEFGAVIEDPAPSLVLPLIFHGRNPEPAVPLTPAAAGGMIAPQ